MRSGRTFVRPDSVVFWVHTQRPVQKAPPWVDAALQFAIRRIVCFRLMRTN
jgi:hypothetical protein